MQRTPAEIADWGATLVIGNIREMRDIDLNALMMVMKTEIERRSSQKQEQN